MGLIPMKSSELTRKRPLADNGRHRGKLSFGGGTVKSGRHLRYPKNTPLTNLYLSMLDRIEATTDTLGDSTGRLTDLDS